MSASPSGQTSAEFNNLVRKRTGLDEHGAKLFSQAFVGPNALLVWKRTDQGERSGRGGLFTSAYIAYRNPRAHVELDHEHRNALAEFLLLNHLFRLEAEALTPIEAEQQVALDQAEAALLSDLEAGRS